MHVFRLAALGWGQRPGKVGVVASFFTYCKTITTVTLVNIRHHLTVSFQHSSQRDDIERESDHITVETGEGSEAFTLLITS